jgi:hypothetical protein
MNAFTHPEFDASLTFLGSAPPSQIPAKADRRSTHMLELLEAGFQKDARHFKTHSVDLKVQLGHARSFGADYGSPDDWNEIWSQRWDQVELIISKIESVTETGGDILITTQPTGLRSTLASWDAILAHSRELTAQVVDLRTFALTANSTTSKNWERLVESLAALVSTAESCLLALQLKIELLKGPSRAEVDSILGDLMKGLPVDRNPAAKRALTATEEYDEAVTDLSRERHQALGFFDAVKTMFMWSESPEERVNKNHPVHGGTI